MNKNTAFTFSGMLTCSVLLLAGCASSNLVDIWSDTSFQAPPMKKVLVISAGKNPVARRIWEDTFSSEFAKHDVTAIPSYRLFPDALPDTNQVIQSVRSNGFDGVLVTRRRPTKIETQYLRGSVKSDQNVRYDRYNDRFETYYVDVVTPGYIDSTKIDVRGIDVWSTRNGGHMVWSASSNTSEPNTIDDVRPKIAAMVMDGLAEQTIIAPSR